MKSMVYDANFTFYDKVCLELGPGNTLINACKFLHNGAKKVILVDKYPRYIFTKKQAPQIENEITFLRNKYCGSQKFDTDTTDCQIDTSLIELITSDLKEVNLPEKIDFAYSVSVFEHIKNVEDNIKKLSHVIKDGGFMYHSIDLRDHYNFRNPFLFLKYSNSTWEKYLTKEGISYTNRVRYTEFKRLFEKYGFKIVGEDVVKFPIPELALSGEFNKSDENLGVGIWKVLLAKRK